MPRSFSKPARAPSYRLERVGDVIECYNVEEIRRTL